MHSQDKTATPSAEEDGGKYHSEWNIFCPPQGSCQWPSLQADYSQVPVDWDFQSTTWPDRECVISAPTQEDQLHNMDWFKDGSVLESEVEVFTRNPTIEPYSVIKPNMSDKPPDGGWRTTSWQDFEEFTRLVCGNQGHSSHTLNSIPWQLPRRQFKCSVAKCSSRFRYFKGLQRHLSGHLAEESYVCWVPECQRSFTRRDNLKSHYATHGRQGGRNRYVASLDPTSSIYDPCFRGQLTSDGLPVREANIGLPDI